MLLAWDNKADSATLTEGSEIATLPVENIQDTRLSRKWHTAAGVEASHVTFDMGAAVSADLLAVLGTNLSAAATMRLRASQLDPKALGAERYDSGVISGGVKANYNAVYKAFKAAYMTLDAAEVPAFYIDYTQGSIAPLIGDVTPTFTRATTATVKDFEALVRLVKSGEARFEGMRRVENLVATKSEDWSNAAWNKTTMTATAGDLTATAGNATCLQPLTRASANYQLRVKMRRKTGAGNVQLTIDNASFTTVTLTTYDQVFAITQNGVTNPNFGIRIVTNADAVYASEIQLEDVTGQANTNPAEYVSVGVIAAAPYHGATVDGVKYFPWQNGNTVASNVVTEAKGATISTAINLGLLSEGARTNRCLRSAEFDNAAWVKTNVTVTANDAAAPDGTTTADLLTATAGNGTVIQDLGVVASAAKAGGLWIKRKTGAGNIDLTLDGGASWTTKAVTAAWTRIEIAQTLADEDFGIRLVTSGDEVWVWGGQVETAAFLSTDLPTTSAAASRNADTLTYPSAGWFNAVEGTCAYRGVSNAYVNFQEGYWQIYTDSSNILFTFRQNGTNQIRSRSDVGGVAQATLINTPHTAGTEWRHAFAYKLNDFAASLDGGTVQTDSSGTVPACTTLKFPADVAGASFNRVKRFAYYPKRLTNTQLQAAEVSVNHTVSARYWRLDLADTTLADNLQIGRVVLGPSVDLTAGHQQTYGWGTGVVDTSEVSESETGQEYVDPRELRREIDFELPYLSEAEALDSILDMQQAVGSHGDILAIENIDSARLSQRAIWGRITRLEKPRQRSATEWAVPMTVLETL